VNVTLSGQVINFIRHGFLNQANQIGAIGQITVVQEHVYVLFMTIMIQVIDAIGIEQGASALDAMYLVPFAQQ
jgi:hypothetical protein